jgi:dTMP kinase
VDPLGRVGPVPGAHRGRHRRRPAGPPLVGARFIALEGIDGSGKSTQAERLAAALAERGVAVTATREPGGTPLGERVRGLLLEGEPGRMSPVAEVHLFAAARAQLVHEVVRPALEEGRWVVSDRFLDSSLAYQGVARGLGLDVVLDANRAAVEGCLPDLTVVIDMDPAATAGRRRAQPDRIEAEGEAFLERVAEGYRQVAARFPERVVLVSGEGSVDDVHARVMATVGDLL